MNDELVVGLVSTSDRAAEGVYVDAGIPGLLTWLERALVSRWRAETRLIADEQPLIEQTLISLADEFGCHLILTTGGTGPAARDVTPEATLAVCQTILPGFGEQMRQISLNFVPTAILSRQVGAIRRHKGGATLVVNLPGQPKAIAETLEGLKDSGGKQVVPGIFAAIPYCIDLIGGPYTETNAALVQAFRPKSARRTEST
ncbi:MAG: molybdopterin adenylyltransferase [Rhodocyclaceae bacterium]|nr:molybdopterin adenylyltransferase [Rhodocyclaceae bacterium]MBP7080414.1 molybdopterin adenylyltransferase [Rhodocyclaceae bacterium]